MPPTNVVMNVCQVMFLSVLPADSTSVLRHSRLDFLIVLPDSGVLFKLPLLFEFPIVRFSYMNGRLCKFLFVVWLSHGYSKCILPFQFPTVVSYCSRPFESLNGQWFFKFPIFVQISDGISHTCYHFLKKVSRFHT